MKRFILFLALLVLPGTAWAMPATYGVDVAEVDGSPSVGAYKIVFPSGTMTCSAGVCTYAPSSTSGTFTDFYLVGPDVTHGMTSIAPTADYLAAFQIGSSGGADIYGLSEADQLGALRLTGIIGATDPTDSNPAVIFRGGKKNGTGWQALGAAETPFNFYNYTTSIGRAYGNGEWIFPSIQNTPIGSTIAAAGNFTTVSISTTDLGTPALNATATFSGQVAEITIANNCIIDLTSWPASGKEGKKFLYLTNGGAATITWKTGGGALTPKYVGGAAPSFTASGVDIVAFTSIDGGTTVYLSVVGQDYK
jgi:hypothetical protein